MHHESPDAFIALMVRIALVAGCTAVPPPENLVVSESATERLAGASELRIVRHAGEAAFQMAPNPSWREIQPGVWESRDGEAKRQVVVGEAGHRWLIEQSLQRIQEAGTRPDGSADEVLLQQISQMENLSALAKSMEADEGEAGISPFSVFCDISLFTGASRAALSPPANGAAALARIVCSGGCATFTVTSQACCAGSCTGPNVQSNLVCSTPWLAGSVRNGRGTGAATVNVTPPDQTQSNSSFSCDIPGTSTAGVYNPALSRFYLRNSNTAGYADLTFDYGAAGAGWLPIAGDWNGDGIDTIGLYNPALSRFYLRNSNTAGYADLTFDYGAAGAGWLPIAGDWNGDGIDTIGLYNPALSRFYLRNSNTAGYADLTFDYGAAGAGWKPLTGNWDGL
jgi:ribosomal protein S16